jgi:hypothetical protein
MVRAAAMGARCKTRSGKIMQRGTQIAGKTILALGDISTLADHRLWRT